MNGREYISEPRVGSTMYVEVDPYWQHDALAHPLIKTLRAMFGALWLLAWSPRRFGEAWFRGDKRIPNPAIAMAAAVSVLTILREEISRYLEKYASTHSFFVSFVESLGPYVMYVITGVVAHAVLRLLGSKRRLRTTLGIALLTGAGMGTVLAVALTAPLLAVGSRYGFTDDAVEHLPMWIKLSCAVIVMYAYVHFIVSFEMALAGAHSVRRWKGVVAGMIAVVAVGALCGRLERIPRLTKVMEHLGPHVSLFNPDSTVGFRL